MNPFKYQDREYYAGSEHVPGYVAWGSIIYIGVSALVLVGMLVVAFTS